LQGNKLSDALRRALVGAHGHAPLLFGYGMPFQYGLNVLKRQLKLLGPFTFALPGAEYSLDLAEALLGLQGDADQVILAFDELPKAFGLPDEALLLT